MSKREDAEDKCERVGAIKDIYRAALQKLPPNIAEMADELVAVLLSMTAEQLKWFIDDIVRPNTSRPGKCSVDIAYNPYAVMDCLVEHYWLDARHRASRKNELNFADEDSWGFLVSEASNGSLEERLLRERREQEMVVATKEVADEKAKELLAKLQTMNEATLSLYATEVVSYYDSSNPSAEDIVASLQKETFLLVEEWDWFIEEASKPPESW